MRSGGSNNHVSRFAHHESRSSEVQEMLEELFEDGVEDKLHEECGVFGVWAPGEEVARLTYFGLYALQHRGQESAGIAVSDGAHTVVYKDMGLVAQVFDETSLQSLTGQIAVGHC